MAKSLNRLPHILYFHAGVMPTQAQIDDADRFQGRAVFRNADQVSALAMSALEECDAVAGDVPKRYADNYPHVNDLSGADVLSRISDVDRKHGPVHSIDNERARAGKPPSLGQDVVTAQGAPRPAGAFTVAGGGFVAPQPGNPDNLLNFGSERAENGTEGTNTEGVQGKRLNPQGLPDTGLAIPATGSDTGAATGLVAEGGGTDGFRAPEMPKDEPEAKGKKGSKAGDTGSTGPTGAAS